MGKPTLLSPTLSADDSFHMSSMKSLPAHTSYPYDTLVYDDRRSSYSHPQSRYSTPLPENDLSIYGNSSPYSQLGQDLPGNYAPRRQSIAISYSPPKSIGHYGQAPYTPEISPPRSSRTGNTVGARVRLSATEKATLDRPSGVKGGRVAKKKRIPTPRDASIMLTKPLSEIAKGIPHVAVADIAAFVARSTAERLGETSRNKKPGWVKRPMNAFMLYRKAYQDVAKTQCIGNNHQHVSKVCGAGWPMEPDHVHDKFNEWAQIERTNHQQAHPGYKFTPSKPKKGKPDGDIDNTSTVVSDGEDSDWASSHRISRRAPRKRNGRLVSRVSEAPPTSYERYASLEALEPTSVEEHVPLGYAPGRPLPLQYGQLGLGYYEQPMPHSLNGFVPDILTRTPSPTMHYTVEQMDSSPAYTSNFHQEPDSSFDQLMDPSLFNGSQYDRCGSLVPEASVGVQNAWLPLYSDNEDWDLRGAAYSNEGAQYEYLSGAHEEWKVEELDEPSHFEQSYRQTEECLL